MPVKIRQREDRRGEGRKRDYAGTITVGQGRRQDPGGLSVLPAQWQLIEDTWPGSSFDEERARPAVVC